MRNIDNTQDVLDSRDIIERINELEDERQALVDAFEEAKNARDAEDPVYRPDIDLYDAALEAWEALTEWDASEEFEELEILNRVAEEGENSPDWLYGETLIRDSYFTDYIEELINDCYELPKEFNSGDWPWRHMQIDFEAAADEAKQDYFEVDFDGVTYWIRRVKP